jgi:hypothetical protein
VQTAVDHGTHLEVPSGDTRTVTLASRKPRAAGRPGGLLLSDCRAPESLFAKLAGRAAGKASVDPRALGVRTLLHLPRVATPDGKVTTGQVERELSRSARLLRRDDAAVRHLAPSRKAALHELIFAENLDVDTASTLFSCLHYLKSARAESRNFALVDPADGHPVTICSVSPFEWKRIGNQIHAQFGVPHDRIWDVSRVYSWDAAPPNAISYLLSRVRISLGRGKDIDLLTTVVDPNLGFTGSSYRAANWQRWLTVQPRPYLYYDRQYASPRQLRQRFGTSSLPELRLRHPGHCFEQSRVRLLDSLIFCSRINGETETISLDSQRPLRR